MLLARKLRRELLARPGQALALVSVVALGAMLFVSTLGAYRDLQESYAQTRIRLGLAPWHVELTPSAMSALDRVRAGGELTTVEPRLSVELPAQVGSGSSRRRLDLRVLTLPDDPEPALDRLLLIEGRVPQGDDEVVLEKHLAEHHHLHPGSVIQLGAAEAERTVRVSGVAVSAEYLWVSRDATDVMPTPDEFGVGWMHRHAIGQAWIALATPQLLVATASGADPAPRIAALMGADVVRSSTRADALTGTRLLQMDLDGYRGMALFFPLVFLTVAAFITTSLLARLVEQQRAVIGTLTALGMPGARIVLHYLAHALVLGGAGAVLGAGAGLLSARALTAAYATELGIPFVTARAHWDLAAIAVAVSLGVSLLAGAVPAIRVARLRPTESMRPAAPRMSRLIRAARSLRAPLTLQLAIRELLSRPLRALTTALGVAGALVLVVTSGVLVDSMRSTVHSAFDEAQRESFRVDFSGPRPASDALARVRAIPGVEQVDGLVLLPARLESDGRHQDVLAQGLNGEQGLVRSVDANGARMHPGKGLLLPRAVARALHVTVGSVVRMRVGEGAPAMLTVDGFADGVMGRVVSLQREVLAQAAGVPGMLTSVALTTAPGQKEAVRQRLLTVPGAARVDDLAATRARMDQMMALGWVMVVVMLAFSVVLAAAILFNTATLSVIERRRELATIRALGRSQRELGLELTLQNGAVALLGLAAGIPLGLWAARSVLNSFGSDLLALPFVVSPQTVGAGALGTVGVLLIAQWPALREIGRLDLAEAVRVREG